MDVNLQMRFSPKWEMKYENIENCIKYENQENIKDEANIEGFIEVLQETKIDKTDNTTMEIFNCNLCASEFSTGRGVYYHKLRVHCEPVNCQLCSKVFKSKNGLGRHTANEHENRMRYKCDICDKTIKSASSLKHHVMLCGKPKTRRRGEGKFLCDICNNYYYSFRNLMEHKVKFHVLQHANVVKPKEENGDIIVCVICHQGFKKKKYLNSHLKNVHRATECNGKITLFNDTSSNDLEVIYVDDAKQTFKCPKCSEEFETNQSITEHMETVHACEHPFECKLCDKIFQKKQQLVMHERRTHISRKYICNDCGQRFKLKHQLRIHESRHFNKK
jgi:KRAB domain-containing zinc finger protein